MNRLSRLSLICLLAVSSAFATVNIRVPGKDLNGNPAVNPSVNLLLPFRGHEAFIKPCYYLVFLSPRAASTSDENRHLPPQSAAKRLLRMELAMQCPGPVSGCWLADRQRSGESRHVGRGHEHSSGC